jgi:DNA-binding protein HU-beta
MNKGELVNAIHDHCNLSKSDIAYVVDEVVKNILSALQRGDDVVFVGFGRFSVADRAAKVGRNPQTGKPVAIPARRVPTFKPGQTLKDAVA